LTDKILAEIKRKQKGSKITPLYADVQLFDEFKIQPKNLTRTDKMILNYYLIMKNYYQDKAIEKASKKQERDKQFWGRMPAVKR